LPHIPAIVRNALYAAVTIRARAEKKKERKKKRKKKITIRGAHHDAAIGAWSYFPSIEIISVE
jgi:hypothetical protein